MKTRWVISLMVLAAFMLMSQPAMADDLADLKAAHKMEQKAFATGDVETGFGYFHEGLIYIPSYRGFPLVVNLARAKPFWIKWFETHSWRPRDYKTEFRVIGNTGLVWGVREIMIINKKTGSATRDFEKVSHIWVKSDGKWKLALIQAAPIPSKLTLD